jgi:two-component system CheB/CheR fusion protein
VEHSQTELRRALSDAESARRELEAADETKDRFLAILSHELRNPLASIASSAMVMTSAATADTLDSDRSRAVEVIVRQSSAMSALLDDLLDVSRLRLGRLAFDKRPTSISAVIQMAVESARPALLASNHQLTVHLPAHDLEVHADPQRLVQVAINLLTNAAKYTPPGGHIHISAELHGGEVVTTVIDDGIGMEPASIERMFDMFTQASQVGVSSTGGLGIGLALARSILDNHEGWIEAHSEGVGRGSRVQFGLPLLRANPGYNPTPPSPQGAGLPKTETPQCVLVVDDNPDAAWGMAKLLEIAGYRVLVADSAQRGLQLAEEHRPSVALLDIGMPDMDGRVLAQRLRATDWGRQALLVATTGWGQESDVRRSLEAGFDAHLVEPVSVPQLRQLINDHAARRG